MGFDEGYIDIDLQDPTIDEDRAPLPEGTSPVLKVVTVEMKKKEGGTYPYIAIMLQPDTGDPKLDRRKLFVNLTTHPQMRWQLRDFLKAARCNISKPNYNELMDKKLRVTLRQVPSQRDPEHKVNEVIAPFHSVL